MLTELGDRPVLQHAGGLGARPGERLVCLRAEEGRVYCRSLESARLRSPLATESDDGALVFGDDA